METEEEVTQIVRRACNQDKRYIITIHSLTETHWRGVVGMLGPIWVIYLLQFNFYTELWFIVSGYILNAFKMK